MTRLFTITALLVTVFAFVGDAVPHPAQSVRILVTVQPAQSLSNVTGRIESMGYPVHASYGDLHALETSAASDAVARLETIEGVRYAEPVSRVTAADSPSDPLYGSESQYLTAVGAPAAWDITTGSRNIVVAVVDTGVDIVHPDLAPNIWVNPAEVPNNGADDDNNGCVDDVNGCSFVSDSSPGCHDTTNGFVNDDIGHGTFVSSVIAGAGDGKGMVGVARNVRIMPIKVLDCYGSGDNIATARGIMYAVHNGARVINLSLGGIEDSQAVRDAIDQATDGGTLVVAASGNSGASGVAFPAKLPRVLAVGAASRANPSARASFSSWGPEVGVVAVGEDVIGAVPPSRCGYLLPCLSEGPWAAGDGTSFSTPQVSGLAALILSLNPALTPARIISIIENSATAVPPASTPGWSGSGRVNMVEALRSVRGDRPPGDACVVAYVVDGERFKCQDGRTIRMLQIAAPQPSECGGDWALAALANIFLPPGRTVYLRYDVGRSDAQGSLLAAPLWRGDDGADYNIAIIMVYVGLAKAADVGSQNAVFHDWSAASEAWAHAARWNMWAPGKPFTTKC